MIANLIVLIILSATNCQYAVVDKEIGSTYVKLFLNYTGSSEYYVKPKSKVVKNLVFHFKALTYNEFTFKIYDANKSRFQVPQGGIFPLDEKANFSFPLSIASYKINYTTNHFSFMITRKDTDAVLFDSSVVELEFSDYYIQFGTILDSKFVFGYSERNTKHFTLKKGTWTVWNREQGYTIDEGIALDGAPTYGYFPAYFVRQLSGLNHLGYYRTTSALDVQVQSFSNTSYLKIYRAIGGIIDMRFILGSSDVEELITDFHSFIGKSLIPPFWSLGYHQSRWGYQNVSMLENVIAKYKQNGIPLDTIWSDIDYMHEFQTFTVDTDNFPLNRLKTILQDYQYIPIVEPSVRNKIGYAYNQGKKRNVFIQSAEGDDLIGKVWSGKAVFPDFFHPNATQYWKDMMQYLYNQVPFSGVWLDMNEITNMCDGPCETSAAASVIDYTNDIPYTPGGGTIEKETIPLNSTHYGKLQQSNVHNLFGLMHTYNTYEFLKGIGKKPFIITRSTTLGSNRYGFHWTGDNFANFTYLKMSIVSNFLFNVMGIQMVGSDICGFGGNTTEQLCSRFYQLGSLYPFARNHNQFQMIDQQAYALGPIVLQSSKKNLKLRYSLLKFYFRQFMARGGLGTIFRPLFFEFNGDENLLQDQILQTQFLIGKSLMSTPILDQGKTQRTAYFPGQIWYNFHTGQAHQPHSINIIQNKLTDLVPLFIRQGYIIFRQNVDNITKSRELNNKFQFVGAFKKVSQTKYTSSGNLLALGNYNNEDEVEKCRLQNCDYSIEANLMISQGKPKEIQLKWSYSGKSVKYVQLINNFTIYMEGRVIKHTPTSEISIYGSGQTTIQLA